MRIGVFDSGVGGLTVLAVLTKRFPSADFVYFGDNANLPYGTKSPNQIRRLCGSAAKFFKEMKVDSLVVACNTASSLALGVFRMSLPSVPVFGVVEPGALAALEVAARQLSKNGKSSSGKRSRDLARPSEEVIPIAVFATRATVSSHAYEREIRQLVTWKRPKIRVIEQECPLLVPMIEEGWVKSSILDATLRVYTCSVQKKSRRPGIAILGCTHYPWIKAQFVRALPGWIVLSSAERVAVQVGDWIQNTRQTTPSKAKGRRLFKFSDYAAVPQFALRIISRTYGPRVSLI